MSNFIDFEPGKYIKTLLEEGIEVYLSENQEHVYFLTPVGDSFIFEAGLMFGTRPVPWTRFTFAKTKK